MSESYSVEYLEKRLGEADVALAAVTAERDALRAALRALGTIYNDNKWHYFDCPSRHGFKDCDKRCRDAAALASSQEVPE